MLMNILFINHYAHEPELGGCQRYHNWGKVLVNQGHSVTIFSASSFHGKYHKNLIENKKLFRESTNSGIHYVYIYARDYESVFSRIINMFEFHRNTMRTYKSFTKPEVIIARTPNPLSILSAYKISRRLKIPYICDVVDLWPQSAVEHLHISSRNPIIGLSYVFEKWMYIKSNAIIFSMEGGYDYIKDRKWENKISKDKVFHINMGIDLILFNKNLELYKIDETNMERTDIFKVVYCGSVRTANNVKLICDAAKELKSRGNTKIKFFIHGSGVLVEPLKEYCLINKIDNIKFYGRISKKQIPYLVTNSDLNLLNYQNVGLFKYGVSFNKMFDYFAGGNPILGNCDFGYNLIKRYKCGVIQNDLDANKYADAILSFYNITIEERTIYGTNARRAAEDFSQLSLVAKLYDIFTFLEL